MIALGGIDKIIFWNIKEMRKISVVEFKKEVLSLI
jgi:hypothetical protein